ncbi:uncharacterized protein IWZ02DRAFT_205492 [Phyllosticta citriasiana]|uniref:uncharacterized protein n=1 Tax=Phyllosticta citriasiana TaxID=595635 RepID=UPI0030FDF2E0
MLATYPLYPAYSDSPRVTRMRLPFTSESASVFARLPISLLLQRFFARSLLLSPMSPPTPHHLSCMSLHPPLRCNRYIGRQAGRIAPWPAYLGISSHRSLASNGVRPGTDRHTAANTRQWPASSTTTRKEPAVSRAHARGRRDSSAGWLDGCPEPTYPARSSHARSIAAVIHDGRSEEEEEEEEEEGRRLGKTRPAQVGRLASRRSECARCRAGCCCGVMGRSEGHERGRVCWPPGLFHAVFRRHEAGLGRAVGR